MGRIKGESLNISNYHYRVDILDDSGEVVLSKYYFTHKEIMRDFRTSYTTIKRIMTIPDYVPTISNMKGIKIYRDTQPAITLKYEINEELFGELDDLE